jgi:hypothetical protein
MEDGRDERHHPRHRGQRTAEEVTCKTVSIPGGITAIVCGPTRRCKCGRPAKLFCDWKMPKRKSGTCDRPICKTCAVSPAPDRDLCPEHAKAFEVWKATRDA